MRQPRSLEALATLAAAALLACGEPAPERPEASSAQASEPAGTGDLSPSARPDIAADLREAESFEFHASDGGGRAWLISHEPQTLQAGVPARLVLGYEAGPLGVAEGGAVYLQVSPFWGWSTPQVLYPDAPGYTLVETDAEGLRFHAETLAPQLLSIRIEGRALRAGERLTLTYGAGPAAADVDQYADADARLWFAVDGDGDGLRKLLLDSPSLRVVAGPPAQLSVLLPSVARPGEIVRVHLAVLDFRGSRGVEVTGTLTLQEEEGVLSLPAQVELRPEDGGVRVLEAEVLKAGVARVYVTGPGELAATSNPLRAGAGGPRILWADLHGHSGLSDGTGTPDDYFAYARDVAGLDVVALTDHDHWGMRVLADSPEMWEQIRESVARFDEPGRFVTLLGFEWTNWLYGHRHVLYFEDDGPVIDSVDPATQTPQQLWQALEGHEALTFAHHSAGGPIATAWNIPPDPHFEPVTEVVSVHGSSEAEDSPGLIYDSVKGNFVRDAALGRGYRLGFVGSGDSHDGHPGLAQLTGPSGGLAAILAEERTREAVLAALRARRVYATNGARIVLRMALGNARMGETLAAATVSEGADLFVQITGSAPLEAIDVVRRGEPPARTDLEGLAGATLHSSVEGLVSGDWLYVRVLQEDGGAAWSSPVFVE